ncbi:MAG: RIP metalloprotease RseP, partial [Chloroflexi bacterium]|nr:RIP metalloprotease RseP [Chloroflexota bacterium]
MQTLLAFAAVLLVVVVVHEFGHFGVARLFKVKVREFGIGYPPRLFSFTRGETIYSINLLPLGGFVSFSSEEDPDVPDSLASHSAWVRLAVMAAGPLMNAVLPIILLTIVFMVPTNVPVTDVIITDTSPGSPAEQAGLLSGDIVQEVDGRTINNSGDLRTAIHLRLGASSEWVVDRGGEVYTTSLVSRKNPPEGQGAAGITFADARVTITRVAPGSTAQATGLQAGDLLLWVHNQLILDADDVTVAIAEARAEQADGTVSLGVLRNGEIQEYALAASAAELSGLELVVEPEVSRSEPIWEAVPSSLTQMGEILIIAKNEISRMVSGSAPVGVAGPIGIAQLTGEVARSGLVPLIFWTALISMNLAIVNLLPIPALDGGRITFVLLELLRGGRRITPEKERLVPLVGFVLVI